MTTERKVDSWIDDIVGALLDPIIVMPGGWGDDLPEWLRASVTIERLGENMVAMREGREITATDAEVACYLFTASLTAPMPSDFVQIYLYIASKVIKKNRTMELPKEINVESLTKQQEQELRRLKDWIYWQRVKHRKEKARGERRQEKKEAEAKQLETKPAQQPFF